MVTVARCKHTGNDTRGIDGCGDSRRRKCHRRRTLNRGESAVGQEDESKAWRGDGNGAHSVIALNGINALVPHKAPVRLKVISEGLRFGVRRLRETDVASSPT